MKVTITAFRQGDFWREPVHPGQVLELPDEVAEYLVGVGAAEPADAAESAESEPAGKPPAGKAKGK